MGFGNQELKNICLDVEGITEINDLNDVMDVIANDIKVFSNVISSFFVGKREEIKNIYTAIRENKYPHNRVNIIDVSFAIRAYYDYFNGLQDFINKVLTLTDTDEISPESVNNTISNIIQKDKEFIASIFGGNENKPISETIDSAMKNIEELIEVDNSFSRIISSTESIVNTLSNINYSKYNTEKITALKLYVISIRNYIYNCINTIFDTFNAIKNSMVERVKAHRVVVPTYQVF